MIIRPSKKTHMLLSSPLQKLGSASSESLLFCQQILLIHSKSNLLAELCIFRLNDLYIMNMDCFHSSLGSKTGWWCYMRKK